MKKYIYLTLICFLILNCTTESDNEWVAPVNTEKEENPNNPIEEDVVVISSLEELRDYASKDNGNIKMEPGTYTIDDASYFKIIAAPRYDDTNDEIPDGTYNISTLFHFSGNNNVFDLTGVKIKVDTSIYPEIDNDGKINEVFITGNGNTIKGLEFRNLGDGYSAAYTDSSSAIMLTVTGEDITLEDVSLYVVGSYPYGYGFLLGKGGGGVAVDLHKHSSLLLAGINTKLLRCNVITRAFGHGIVMQGAVNTHIEDCYVEGEMRNTNDMLAETSGPAYETGFYSDYAPGTIQPNQMIALAEDGVRTYATGPLSPHKNSNVTVLNTTVKNMRGGFDLVAGSGDRTIKGCTAIGCQTQGFSGGSGITITDSKGDAQYGPLLSFWYTSGKNGVVELELMNTESDYPPTRLAEINGTGHNIILTNYENKARETPLPIVFGASFWGDTRTYRYPAEDPDTHAGAWNVGLVNETKMPIVFTKLTSGNSVTTNGTVTSDEGEGNNVTYN